MNQLNINNNIGQSITVALLIYRTMESENQKGFRNILNELTNHNSKKNEAYSHPALLRGLSWLSSSLLEISDFANSNKQDVRKHGLRQLEQIKRIITSLISPMPNEARESMVKTVLNDRESDRIQGILVMFNELQESQKDVLEKLVEFMYENKDGKGIPFIENYLNNVLIPNSKTIPNEHSCSNKQLAG